MARLKVESTDITEARREIERKLGYIAATSAPGTRVVYENASGSAAIGEELENRQFVDDWNRLGNPGSSPADQTGFSSNSSSIPTPVISSGILLFFFLVSFVGFLIQALSFVFLAGASAFSAFFWYVWLRRAPSFGSLVLALFAVMAAAATDVLPWSSMSVLGTKLGLFDLGLGVQANDVFQTVFMGAFALALTGPGYGWAMVGALYVDRWLVPGGVMRVVLSVIPQMASLAVILSIVRVSGDAGQDMWNAFILGDVAASPVFTGIMVFGSILSMRSFQLRRRARTKFL